MGKLEVGLCVIFWVVATPQIHEQATSQVKRFMLSRVSEGSHHRVAWPQVPGQNTGTEQPVAEAVQLSADWVQGGVSQRLGEMEPLGPASLASSTPPTVSQLRHHIRNPSRD